MPQHIDWQMACTLLLIAGAAFAILRRVRRLLAGAAPGCGSGGCGDCPSNGSTSPAGGRSLPLVSLDSSSSGSRRASG